jgi:hypothetical protein
MWHDLGLALIYGPVLGAWFYPSSNGFCGGGNTPKVLRDILCLKSLGQLYVVFHESESLRKYVWRPHFASLRHEDV